MISSINKGQILPLGLFLIILLAIWKVPSEAIPAIFNILVQELDRFHIFGWILWILTSMVWYTASKFRRVTYQKEITRMGQEKSDLHTKLLGSGAPSSEPKRLT